MPYACYRRVLGNIRHQIELVCCPRSLISIPLCVLQTRATGASRRLPAASRTTVWSSGASATTRSTTAACPSGCRRTTAALSASETGASSGSESDATNGASRGRPATLRSVPVAQLVRPAERWQHRRRQGGMVSIGIYSQTRAIGDLTSQRRSAPAVRRRTVRRTVF